MIQLFFGIKKYVLFSLNVRWSELVLAHIELILGHVIFSTILIQKLNFKLFILFLNSNSYPFYQ